MKHSPVTLSVSYGQWMAGTEAIYHEIRAGKLNPADLTEALFDQKIKEYSRGVGKGLGKDWLEIDFNRPNYSLYEAARLNIYSFAGAATYHHLVAMNEIFIRDGKFVPYNEFKAKIEQYQKEVMNVNRLYNKTYLESEYLTARAQAEAASRWQEHLDNADILPFLRYKTMGDDLVREDHAALDGVIRPIDDPFWDVYYPPNGWRCRCYVEGTSDEPNGKGSPGGAPKLPDGFRNNVGKTGVIFPEKHPYFKNMPPGERDKVLGRAIEYELKDRIVRQRLSYEAYASDPDYTLGFFDDKSGGYVVTHNKAEPTAKERATGEALAKLGNSVLWRPHIRESLTKNPDILLNMGTFDIKIISGEQYGQTQKRIREAIKGHQALRLVLEYPTGVNIENVVRAIKDVVSETDKLKGVYLLSKGKGIYLDRRLLTKPDLKQIIENAMK